MYTMERKMRKKKLVRTKWTYHAGKVREKACRIIKQKNAYPLFL